MTTRVLEHFIQKFDFDSLKSKLLADFDIFRKASEMLTRKPLSSGPARSGVEVPKASVSGAPSSGPQVPKASVSASARSGVAGVSQAVILPSLPGNAIPGISLPPTEDYKGCVANLSTDADFLNFLTAPLTNCTPLKGGYTRMRMRNHKTRRISTRGSSTRRKQRRS